MLLLLFENRWFVSRWSRWILIILAAPFTIFILQALVTDGTLDSLLKIGPVYIVYHALPIFAAHQEAYNLSLGYCRLSNTVPFFGTLLRSVGESCIIVDEISRNLSQEALTSGTRLGTSSLLHAKYVIDNTLLVLIFLFYRVIAANSQRFHVLFFTIVLFYAPYFVRRSISSYTYDVLGASGFLIIFVILLSLLPRKGKLNERA